MPIQKYDIRRPAEQGGEFEVRYWSPINAPVLGKDGSVRFIIHRVEDVTDAVRMKSAAEENSRHIAQLRSHAEHLELEAERRTQEVRHVNELLRTLSDELARAKVAAAATTRR